MITTVSAASRSVSWVRSIRAWLQGSDDPRMAFRAEKILVVAAVVIRGTFVLQLTVTLITSWQLALRPGLFVWLSSLMIAESVALGWLVLRRGRYEAWVAVVDLCFAAAISIAEAGAARPQEIVGSWVSWGYAAAVATAVPAAIGLRRWRVVIIGAVFMAVAYLVAVLPHPISAGARTTAITNALSVVGFSVACRLGGGFVRIMGQEADRARTAEARAAAAAQLERQRTLLHNHASVLSLLSQDIDDPRLRESAMGAAARGARQIHALLADGATMPRTDASGAVYLRSLAEEVCEEFTDLPLVKNLDLLGACTVPQASSEPLVEALRTLVWNVREHSGADRVTVHGEVRVDGGWTLSVTDDGKGFDADAVPRGFGLRVQAGSALARIGVSVMVDSAPGEGTRVQLVSAGPS
jgi:signal transduction histidine kinase